MNQIQYISDEHNKVTGVIIPIDLWKEIQSEKETAYLFKSENMKTAIDGSEEPQGGHSF